MDQFFCLHPSKLRAKNPTKFGLLRDEPLKKILIEILDETRISLNLL